VRAAALLGAAALLASCADAPAPADASAPGDLGAREADRPAPVADRPPTTADARPTDCDPLVLEPARLRLAANSVGTLRASGGSRGLALFHADDPAALRGTRVTLGGEVVAGGEPVTFRVTVDDGLCGLRASAEVEVVGPMAVEPSAVRLRPGASVRFQVTGLIAAARWVPLGPLAPATGAFDAATGTFTAGTAPGSITWLVRDTGSAQEATVTVEVAADAALRARVPVLLVPVGRRVRIEWTGGSDALTPTLAGAAGGALVREGGALWFDATGARPGLATVTALDRATGDRATARVVVGEELAATTAVRGEGTPWGSAAWGDVNGDGRPDLAVGHPTMQGAATYGGRAAVYLAGSDGALPAAATSVVDGPRANDFVGQVLAIADVTGDGRGDLLVGSPERDLNRANVGTLEVWVGGPGGLGAAPVQTLLGAAENERFASAFTVQDVAGDPSPDLIVVSPGARGPAVVPGPCVATGRVFIHRGAVGAGRPFEPVPWQTLEYYVPDADPARCHNAEVLAAANAPALIDVDGDGARDLVLGVPSASTDRAEFLGRVIAYRGLGRMGFEPRPSWVVSLAEPMALASFGAGVDAVATSAGPALLVRAPRYHRDPATGALTPQLRGAVFAFAGGSFAGAATMAAPRFVTTALARARFIADLNDGAGAASAAGDVDGDGADDYLVSGWIPSLPSGGKVWMFSGPALARALTAGALTPTWTVAGAATEMLGSALAVDRSTAGPAHAVAVSASMRTTRVGYLTGAVDVLAPGAAADPAARWARRAPIEVPQRAGGDGFGAAVAVGALAPGRAGDAVVGAPLAHTAAGATVRARTGAVSLYGAGSSAATGAYVGEREFGQLGSAVATLDFNGDGRVDLAIGEATAPAGGWEVVRRGLVAPPPDDRCFLHTAAGAVVDAAASNRGLVRIYTQQADGRLLERFHVYGREDAAERGMRAGVGGTVANALDVNNDGRQDLIVTHAQSAGGNGAEVILGRPDDTMGRVQVVCGDPATAPWWPLRAASAYPTAAGLGDLDGDGCGEVIAGIAGAQRPIAVVQFGFGPRCARAHAAPFELTLIASVARLDDNRVGVASTRDDDDYDRVPATFMGGLVAGPGDVTGDRVPDLVVRRGSWALGDNSDPALEVVSGAYLAGLCPDRRCPAGRTGPLWSDGAYRRVALEDVGPPHHFVLHSAFETDASFGSAVAGGDLDGDGVAELVVGAPLTGYARAQAGAVLAWRGGASAGAFAGDPWLMAVGDLGALAGFGAAVATSPAAGATGAWIVVGAPGADERGPETGAAYRWMVPR
jgi:hypothetical protein